MAGKDQESGNEPVKLCRFHKHIVWLELPEAPQRSSCIQSRWNRVRNRIELTNGNAQNTRRLDAAPPGPALRRPRFDGDGHFVFEQNRESDATPSVEASADLRFWTPLHLPQYSVEPFEDRYEIRVPAVDSFDERWFYRVATP